MTRFLAFVTIERGEKVGMHVYALFEGHFGIDCVRALLFLRARIRNEGKIAVGQRVRSVLFCLKVPACVRDLRNLQNYMSTS